MRAVSLLAHLRDVAQGKAPLGALRSPEWPRVRREHLKKHPRCSVCDGKEKLQVHHLKVFHLYPELELDPSNLVTACEAPGRQCHLRVCHGGNFRAWVPNTLHLIQRMREALKAECDTLEEARRRRKGG